MPEILLSQRFTPEIGGSISWLLELAKRWPRPLEVVTHRYQENAALEASGVDSNLPGIAVTRRDIQMHDWGLDSLDSLTKYLRMLTAVKSLCRNSCTNIVYGTHLVPEIFSLLPLKAIYGSRLKLVSFAHGEEFVAYNQSRQLRLYRDLSLRMVNLVIANSQHTKRLVQNVSQSAPVTVIEPGVDCKVYSESKDSRLGWRSNRGVTESEVVLLTLGRLEKRKNHLKVIESVSELSKKGVKVKYYIAGSGPEESRIRALVDSLGLQREVFILGRVSEQEKLSALSGCDIFIMPAVDTRDDFEGYGIVFLEAAASGKPSIAGKAGGQSEAIRDGLTGILVDGDSVAEISQAIEHIAENKSRRESMGVEARLFAEQRDWEIVTQRTILAVQEFVAADSSL